MKKRSTFLFISALSAFTQGSYANTAPNVQFVATPEPKIQAAEPKPNLSPITQQTEAKTLRFAVKDLYQNKALTEQVLSLAIEQQNEQALQKALKVYRTFDQQDQILLLFAQGRLATLQRQWQQAVFFYRQLIAQDPELHLVRFELAVALFEDQQNEAAQAQFEQLRSLKLSASSLRYVEAYLEALRQRNGWQVSASAHYVRDDNVNKVSNHPTIEAKNFPRLTKNPSMLPQKAEGISYYLDISRQFNLQNHHYLHFENDLSGKWYWDNHSQDDMFNRTLLGYANKTAKQEWKILPFYQRQWSGNQRYNKSVGIRLEHSYWLTPKLQLASALEFAKHRYHQNTALNGESQLISQTLFWQQSPTQYFYVGGDINQTRTKERQYSNLYQSLRLGWGKSWQWGISSRLSTSIAQRKYKDEAVLSGWLNFGKIRQDNIYQVNLILWKRDWYVWNITPKLQFSWKKQQSNIAQMYSFQEKNVFLIFEKRF